MAKLDKILYANEDLTLGIGTVNNLENCAFTTIQIDFLLKVLSFLKELKKLGYTGIDVVITENKGFLVLGALSEKYKKATGILIAPFQSDNHRYYGED